MNQIRNWIELLGDSLKQLGQLLQGQRPALQPVPVRVRPERQTPPSY